MVKELTAQQVFEKVAKHLAKQGKKAIRKDGFCINFTGSELRCAAGCLVPRSFYRKPENSKYREGGLSTLFEILPKFGVPYATNKEVSVLMGQLVVLHDTKEVEEWSGGLRDIATRLGLSIPEWLQKC